MEKLEKILWALLYTCAIICLVIAIAMGIYVIICYADILAHNLSGGSENSWNIFLRALDNA